MNFKFLTLAATMAVMSTSAFAGNYVLSINGKTQEIDLGQASTITLDDGKTLEVKVDKKEFHVFKTNNYSFEYPSDLQPSRTDLGDGIFQTMMASPIGTLILVQEYENMDPSSIVDLMIQELTKEEVQYGYKIDKTDAARKIGGLDFVGKKAVATYKGEQNTRYVMTHSAKDSGLMVITMVDKEAPAKDVAMVKKFWDSLSVSMQ